VRGRMRRVRRNIARFSRNFDARLLKMRYRVRRI